MKEQPRDLSKIRVVFGCKTFREECRLVTDSSFTSQFYLYVEQIEAVVKMKPFSNLRDKMTALPSKPNG